MVSDVSLHGLVRHFGLALRRSLCRCHPPVCFACAMSVDDLLGLVEMQDRRRRYILRLPTRQGSSALGPA